MDEPAKVDLSVVIPVYNEEDSLAPLVAELEAVLPGLGKIYEVLFVNDGSKDRSLEILKSLASTRPWLRVLTHRTNCGESAAEATGFRHARGDAVATMDADLQNDPADLPKLLAELERVSCAAGVRRRRLDSIVKRVSSRLGNWFRNAVTGDFMTDAGCTYRTFRKSALAEVPVFNGMHRFIPTLLRAQGYAVAEVLVNHRPRTRGVSKYGIGNRMWRGIRDCFAVRWYRKRAVLGDRVLDEGS